MDCSFGEMARGDRMEQVASQSSQCWIFIHLKLLGLYIQMTSSTTGGLSGWCRAFQTFLRRVDDPLRTLPQAASCSAQTVKISSKYIPGKSMQNQLENLGIYFRITFSFRNECRISSCRRQLSNIKYLRSGCIVGQEPCHL